MFAVILNSDLDIHQFRCWPTTNTVADELNHSGRPDPVLQRQVKPNHEFYLGFSRSRILWSSEFFLRLSVLLIPSQIERAISREVAIDGVRYASELLMRAKVQLGGSN